MTIDQAFQFINFCCNKNQSGNISPSQFNMLAPLMQISVINELLGIDQKYQPHSPVPNYGFGISQKVREELRPIMVKPTTTAVASGIAVYPPDCLYLNANITASDSSLITEATSDEIAILNKSVIKPPTATSPKFSVYSDGIYIFPSSITSIKLSYVRRPATPVWAYTITNDVPVYTSSGSQDFELAETSHLLICMKILQAVGVNLNLDQVTAYAMQKEAVGA